MRKILRLLALGLGITSSAHAADYLPTYARSIKEPQLFFDNAQALDGRLKLLDMAGPGAEARIATFLYDEGQSSHTLAVHLCSAARRGVDVQLLVDSKSGGIAGSANSFDREDVKRKVEEIYQYLANCGVKVYIHNQLTSYVDIFGYRAPNFFLDPSKNGKHFGVLDILTLYHRLDHLLDRTRDLLNDEAGKAGLQTSPKHILATLKKIVLEGYNLFSETANASGYDEPNGYQQSIDRLRALYGDLINDPFWDSVNVLTLPPILTNVEARFKQDPEMGALWREFRRFNRLNHRKLFFVESGPDGCAFLGGRNIGDNYLADNKDNFVDGDVFLCRHHGASAAAALDAARAGFEQLKTDLSDPILGSANDVNVALVAPNPGYQYKLLKGGPEQALGAPRVWADGLPAPGGIPLHDAQNWHYLKSSWNPATDEVLQAMHRMIRQEQREIYIETPYAEFDSRMRADLELAIERGVHVHLVTNSLFISDGPSKLIRVTMEHWMDYMISHFPDRFQVRFVTYAGKHMTHFKGAAFSCQPRGLGSHVQTFVLGSHNFDPRSARDDKNHALTWDQPSGACTDVMQTEFVTGRSETFARLARSTNTPILTEYPSLYDELVKVSGSYSPRDPGNALLAKALMEIFYSPATGGYDVAYKDRVWRVLSLLDAGGLHDLLGRVL